GWRRGACRAQDGAGRARTKATRRPSGDPADGRSVAFVRALPDHSCDVYVVNLDGTNPRRVAHLTNTGAPAWTADSRSVVLQARSGDMVALRTVTLPDGEQRTLLSLPALVIALSNDGHRVVYTQGSWTRCSMIVA